MPGVDFWLDWRPTASVNALRRVLPVIAKSHGYRLVERELVTTGPDWAMFGLHADGLGEVGTMRAQTADGATQMFVGPGSRRDDVALAALNRAMLALYCGLLARGLLAPPGPLEVPGSPLIAPEA